MGLRVVSGGDLVPALATALDRGEPIAPLPMDPREARRVIDALQPDQPVTEPDAAVVVATSGSTGRPKCVVLSRAALLASAQATHRRLPGPGTWVTALPTHYVAGLMPLVRAYAAETTALVIDPHLADLATLRLPTPSYLSIVPTQLHRALADRVTTVALARFDAVLLGGSAAAAGDVDRAREAGIRIVTTYGMSETCGGVVYDGMPLDGVDVDLTESARILLTTPTAFSGYRLDPEATAQVLKGRTVTTSDRGAWIDGTLHVLGRVDDVVVSGGVNVDLAELQRVLDGIYGTEQVCALAVADPTWGARVVVGTTLDITLDELKDSLSGLVSSAALPRALRQVSRIPRTTSGKIDRRGWARQWEAQAHGDGR